MNSLSFKTKFGWVSVFEENNKIIRVKFGKNKNKSISKVALFSSVVPKYQLIFKKSDNFFFVVKLPASSSLRKNFSLICSRAYFKSSLILFI